MDENNSKDFNTITGNGKQSVSWKCIVEIINSMKSGDAKSNKVQYLTTMDVIASINIILSKAKEMYSQ